MSQRQWCHACMSPKITVSRMHVTKDNGVTHARHQRQRFYAYIPYALCYIVPTTIAVAAVDVLGSILVCTHPFWSLFHMVISTWCVYMRTYAFPRAHHGCDLGCFSQESVRTAVAAEGWELR
eukprot:m.1050546 g.1050546  ORF g.1050546 m.1050546 type:complete len:122 (+) comp24175_c0_seq8:1772-2137(+)